MTKKLKAKRGDRKRPAGEDVPVDDPHRLARSWLRSLEGGGHGVKVVYYRGGYLKWEGAAYAPVPIGEVRSLLTSHAAREFESAFRDACRAWAERAAKGERKPKLQKVTTRLIGDVVQALGSICLLNSDVDPPAWWGGIDEKLAGDPRAHLAMPNRLLDLRAAAAGEKRCRYRPTCEFFTLNAVTYDFKKAALAPQWLAFLDQIFGTDKAGRANIRALRQWFGYCLTSDTSRQKMFTLIGPPRSGKGTIVRILEELIGVDTVTTVPLEKLESQFAAAPLVEKSLMVVTDLRLSARANTRAIVSRLLSITGEDRQHVEPKYLTGYDRRLCVRVMIVTNEVPQFNDASGALAGRMVVVRTVTSFIGQEDTELTRRLLQELPGILNWALEGLADLTSKGRFTQPKSGMQDIQSLRDMASPVGAFLRDRCQLVPSEKTEMDELFDAHIKWCKREGRKFSPTRATFGRDLRAAAAAVTVKQFRVDRIGNRKRYYVGVKLRPGEG